MTWAVQRVRRFNLLSIRRKKSLANIAEIRSLRQARQNGNMFASGNFMEYKMKCCSALRWSDTSKESLKMWKTSLFQSFFVYFLHYLTTRDVRVKIRSWKQNRLFQSSTTVVFASGIDLPIEGKGNGLEIRKEARFLVTELRTNKRGAVLCLFLVPHSHSIVSLIAFSFFWRIESREQKHTWYTVYELKKVQVIVCYRKEEWGPNNFNYHFTVNKICFWVLFPNDWWIPD